MAPRISAALACLLVLVVLPLSAAVPLGELRYGATRQADAPLAVANGDLALVVWSRADGAARIDASGHPLDVPAIPLPKPQFTSGADVVANEEGWTVAWTVFAVPGSRSQVRLASIARDGVMSGFRDIDLPEDVLQNAETRVAQGHGLFVVAFQRESQVVVVSLTDDRAVSSLAFDGSLRGLASTPSGFVLLLEDRVLSLSSGASQVIDEVLLPAGFQATDVLVSGEDLFVAGGTSDAVVIVRVHHGIAIPETTIVAPRGSVRMTTDGHDLLLSWKGLVSGDGYSVAIWDLLAARVTPGASAADAATIRPAIDGTSRWTGPADPVDLVFLAGSWLTVWAEGYRSVGFRVSDVFSARVGSGFEPVTNLTLVSTAAASQALVGAAASGDVVLVVWREEGRTRAARYTLTGERVDSTDLDLGDLDVRTVRATPDGWVLITPATIRQLEGGESPAPAPSTDISCTPELCLAVWVDADAVRISRWRDGALIDAPGISIPTRGAMDVNAGLAVANDGESFVVISSRDGEPGGRILSAARIERTEEGWRITTGDIAASTDRLRNLRIVFEGDGYLATWQGIDARASRLTREGFSRDGDETGWQGWPLQIAYGYGEIRDLVRGGGRTLVLVSSGRQIVYELHGRTLMELYARDASRAALACDTVCRIVTEESVRGVRWYRAQRLFLDTLTPRTRAVRH